MRTLELHRESLSTDFSVIEEYGCELKSIINIKNGSEYLHICRYESRKFESPYKGIIISAQ